MPCWAIIVALHRTRLAPAGQGVELDKIGKLIIENCFSSCEFSTILSELFCFDSQYLLVVVRGLDGMLGNNGDPPPFSIFPFELFTHFQPRFRNLGRVQRIGVKIRLMGSAQLFRFAGGGSNFLLDLGKLLFSFVFGRFEFGLGFLHLAIVTPVLSKGLSVFT